MQGGELGPWSWTRTSWRLRRGAGRGVRAGADGIAQGLAAGLEIDPNSRTGAILASLVEDGSIEIPVTPV
jgi:hypothetical protein